jgi:light-regulated signal transduction histidine kinase (bacteriophytochrome)
VHKLLERQLKRHGVNPGQIPPQWRQFVDSVDTAYRDAEADRALLERSLEIASQELMEMNGVLRATSAELRRSNEDLEQFAYVASHDLQAPLRAIENLSKWIAEDLGEHLSNDVASKMALLRGRVQRMRDFITGLLEYSRAGRIRSEIERVDLRQMVADIESFLGVRDGIEVVATGDSLELKVARVPLWEVLVNLIGNAVKHHDRATGRIEVSLVDRATSYEFAVKDDGPGIAVQHHKRVFQMFQTLRPRDEVEGVGMGLPLVKKIVTARGGNVTITSGDGRGAEFHFTWPKQEPGDAAQPEPPRRDVDRRPGAAPTAPANRDVATVGNDG